MRCPLPKMLACRLIAAGACAHFSTRAVQLLPQLEPAFPGNPLQVCAKPDSINYGTFCQAFVVCIDHRPHDAALMAVWHHRVLKATAGSQAPVTCCLALPLAMCYAGKVAQFNFLPVFCF